MESSITQQHIWMNRLISALRPRFTGWTPIRWIQLVFGLFLLGDYLFSPAALPVLLFALFLLAQAIFDWQLCGTGRCGPDQQCHMDSRK